MSELNVQLARDHVKQGEAFLIVADRSKSERDVMTATAIATAHFSAAMAITNILLTDPAEAPELDVR
jgi:hypothetical protein